jgi:hypothetical protein
MLVRNLLPVEGSPEPFYGGPGNGEISVMLHRQRACEPPGELVAQARGPGWHHLLTGQLSADQMKIGHAPEP